MLKILKSLLSGNVATLISPNQYQTEFATIQKPHTLIDVRTAEEFMSGHIPGAINLDVQTLEQRLNRVPTDRPVVLYCRSGNRSGQAAQLLQQAGYSDLYNLGGIGDWVSAGFPIK
jgi:rhodanese-related sulfurtransferase